MARLAGFEPTTPAFGGQYSIQLSYRRIMRNASSSYAKSALVSSREERNVLPLPLKSGAGESGSLMRNRHDVSRETSWRQGTSLIRDSAS